MVGGIGVTATQLLDEPASRFRVRGRRDEGEEAGGLFAQLAFGRAGGDPIAAQADSPTALAGGAAGGAVASTRS